MRRFIVYVDVNLAGTEAYRALVELPDNASPADVERSCSDTLSTLIENNLDCGWDELEPGDELPEDLFE